MPSPVPTTSSRLQAVYLAGLLTAAIFLVNAATLTFPFLFDGLPLRLAVVTCAIVATSLGVATWQRNTVHASPLALWSDAAIKSPHNTRAWANVGSALLFAGRGDDAMAAFRQIVMLFEAAVADQPAPTAVAARRTPRTTEYVWYAYDRIGNHALDRGDIDTARRCYDAITQLPDLPKGGLEHPSIRRLRRRLQQLSSSSYGDVRASHQVRACVSFRSQAQHDALAGGLAARLAGQS